MGLLTNPQTGGLQGVVEMFTKKGLGDAMSSWISTGQQVQQALGGDLIQQFARQMGSSKEDVSGGLANLLPDIIDKVTPTLRRIDVTKAALRQHLLFLAVGGIPWLKRKNPM